MAEKPPCTEPDLQEKCDICQRISETSPATHRCIQCSEYLCSSCSKIHNVSKSSMNHVLVTVEEIYAGKLEQITLAIPKYCDAHPTEEIKFYCSTCDSSVCRDCIITKHNQHTCTDIHKAFPSHKNAVEKELQYLNIGIDFEQMWTNLLYKQQDYMKKTSNDLKNEIKAKAESIIAKINQHVSTLVDKVDNHYKNESEMLTKEMNKTREQLETLESMKKHSANTMHHGYYSHKISLHDQVSHTLSKYMSTVTNKHGKFTDMKFIGSDKIDSNGKYGDVSTTDPNSILKYRNLNAQELTFLCILIPTKVELICEFSAHADGELKRPAITGISAHPDTGDIITTDFHNHKLKTFTKAGILKSQVSSGAGYQLSHPKDVAVLQHGNIAVTNYGTDEVLVVLSPDYQMISQFKLSGYTGVAEASDGTLAISSNEPGSHRVEFRAIDGTTVKAPVKHNTFSYPNHIAISPDDKLVVSNFLSHTIHVFSKDNVLLHQYGTKGSGEGQLHTPMGVCIDKQGNILAADSKNNRIQMLSSEGEFIRNLVTSDNGLHQPCAVAINREGHLLVSEYYRDVIKVFKYLPV